MEKKDFDKKVQELMAGFKEEYDPKSWNSFEKKLQFEEEMDELIKSSMESYEEPFNEEHWEILTQEIHRRKVRNIIKRTSEVVIILLLIMTAHNFIQIKGDKYSTNRDHVQLAFLHDSYPQINNNVSVNLHNVEADFTVLGPKANKNIGHEYGDYEVLFSQPEQKENVVSLSEKNIQGEIYIQENSETESNKHISSLNTILIAPLAIENSLLKSPQQESRIELESSNGLWLGLVAGPDVNFVNSPFDLNLLKSPIQSQSGTMTFGATVSKDIGLFEMVTGLYYSSKNYFPFRIRQFVPSINQRYLETSLRSLEFEQIQIPLFVNLHTRRSSGWSMYGSLGLGVNIIANTKYDIETQVRSFSAAPTSSTGVEKLKLSELPRGAFQSGTFGNNVYASAIAGFGIEKRFNNQYAFTLLTTYQRSLSKEINPVINRTQQLSMSLGVKVNLK